MMGAKKHAKFQSIPHTAGTQTPRSLLSGDPPPCINSDDVVKKRVNIVECGESVDVEEEGNDDLVPRSLFDLVINVDKVR